MATPVGELGWRQFTFFDKENVKDPKEPTKLFTGFKDFSIYCWKNSINHKFVILGERTGLIFKVSESMELDFWKAYSYQLDDISLSDTSSHCVLATIGTDVVGGSSILKIWNLNKWDKKSPYLISSCKVSSSKKSLAVCITVSLSNNFIAIGFNDLLIIYSCNDILSEKSSFKWKTIDNDNITNNDELLGLCITKSKNNRHILYILNQNSLSVMILNGNDIIQKYVNDNINPQKNLWFFNEITNQLVVSYQEMIYFYDTNDIIDNGFQSGKCHALGRGMNKTHLLPISSYVGVITKAENKLNDNRQIILLTIYDIEYRYIACMNSTNNGQLFTIGRDVYILQKDGNLSKLKEKPTSLKLDIVLQKHLYDVAISIAKRDNSNELTNIHIKYADYLYNRGDFQNAIQQYIDTIGYVEQSFVIRRFLEGTKASQLAMYIEALHEKNQANRENFMLLLGAYLKIGEKQKVINFVRNSSTNKDFDVEGAIIMLRSSNNFELSSELASKHNKLLLIFAILVEDLQDFDEAVKRLKNVTGKQVFEVLDAYGLTLLEHREEEMITIIEKAVKEEDADIKVLIKLLNGHPNYLKRLYDTANDKIKKDVRMRNAVLEHTLERMKNKSLKDAEFQAHIFDLVDDDNYDIALRLGQLHSYPPLVINILRKLKKYDELLRYLLRDGDIIDIIQECEKEMIKHMWIELIIYLSKKEDISDKYIIELLKKITSKNYVHPLIITNVLSKNKKLPITCVKPYLENWLNEQNKQIKNGIKKIEENTERVNRLERQIQVFDEEVQFFQALKCVACDMPLQIPAVHFMCKHSYHSHCYESYSDQNVGCPACENADFELTLQNKEANSITIEDLQKEINENSNAMSVIAKFLGKGLFDDKVDYTCETNEKIEVKKKIRASTNPFDESTSTNFFESEDLKNPFYEPKSTNPFDEDSTNPFYEE